MFLSILKKTALLAAFALAVMSPAQAVNDLTNPGFEDPIGAEWTTFQVTAGPFIDTTDPHSGTNAAYVEYVGTAGCHLINPYTGSLFVVGQTVHASGYIKVVPGASGTAQTYLGVNAKVVADGGNGPYTISTVQFGAIPTWRRVDLVYTVTKGRADTGTPVPAGDFLAVRFIHDTPGGTGTSTMYVDDALLEAYNPDTSNFLSNGSFELALTNWQPFGAGLTVTTPNEASPLDGSAVAKMEWTAGTGARQLIQDIIDADQSELVPGRPLLFSAWYKATFGAQTNYPALVKVFGDGFLTLAPATFGVQAGATGDKAQWTKLSYLFTVPQSGNYQSLRLLLSHEVPNSAGMTYWDDVRLVDFSSTETTLLSNGSFELGMLGWQNVLVPISTTTVEAVSDQAQAQDGDSFARITYGTQVNATQLIADIPNIGGEGLTNGQLLTLSAFYRAPNLAANAEIALTKGFFDSNGNAIEYSSSDFSIGPKAAWTPISFTFPYVEDAQYTILRVILNGTPSTFGTTGGTIDWDNVTLLATPVPTAAAHWELF